MVIQQIPEHFTIQYQRNFIMKLQQKESRLASRVMRKSGSGESIRFSRMLASEMVEIVSRGGNSDPTDLELEHRWVRPRKFKDQKAKDLFDDAFLGQLVLPESDVITAQVRAANRQMDDLIIEAASGTAYEGETGTTAVTLPSSQQVGVQFPDTHNQGLTFFKVNEAARIMDENEVDEEGRVFVFSAQGKADLISDVLTNHGSNAADLKQIESWQGGEGSFRGFEFVRSERLALNGSTDVRTSLAWQKDCMGLGTWMEVTTFIDRLPTGNHQIQMSVYMSMGSTRIEELGVVEVACDESPA